MSVDQKQWKTIVIREEKALKVIKLEVISQHHVIYIKIVRFMSNNLGNKLNFCITFEKKIKTCI